MYPSEYLYTKEHEWVKVDEDVCQIGITEFAQAELGEVVYVDLPEAGETFGAGDEIGTIESVKAVAEVYTPVAGEVVEINGALQDSPEKVNEDPHGAGWLIKIRIASDEVLKELMSGEEYGEFVRGEDG